MSLTAQWIAVAAVVAAAVWAALRALWRTRRRVRQGRVECAGCPLAGTCSRHLPASKRPEKQHKCEHRKTEKQQIMKKI